MPIYLFIKKAIEKRSYYSDTPGKFALLKELKRNFLQIFVVDSSCFVILWLKTNDLTNDLTNVKSYRPFL